MPSYLGRELWLYKMAGWWDTKQTYNGTNHVPLPALHLMFWPSDLLTHSVHTALYCLKPLTGI